MTPSALDAEGFIARRRSESLAANGKLVHEHGRVSVLRELHDELDRAVRLAAARRQAPALAGSAPAPLDLEQLAAHFSGRGPWKKRLPDIVDSLAALGRVKSETRDGRTVLHG